uniref:Endonuclease/exonuclease/phosphatase domain-containing protein n=1 Tax=Sander lucioperca TaxID=283035 RepID=A0A8D0ATL0_SANLU
MANQKLRIVSFNVNGILNPVKRSKILSKMKKEKAQVVYLQETHTKLRKMGFTNIFFSSYKSKHKRGVAVLLSNKITFEQTYVQKDKEGRFILENIRRDRDHLTERIRSSWK